MNLPKIQALIKELLLAFDEDPQREDLRDTPRRVAESYAELLQGYHRSFADEVTLFDNQQQYNQIILSGKIDFVSLCEHHLLPFYGYAHIGYIPDAKIIGLSKLARAVDIYARRLQNQERMTAQIRQALVETVAPKGVAILLTSQHLCSVARGVSKKDSYMTTVLYHGVFEQDYALQQQFLQLVSFSQKEHLS